MSQEADFCGDRLRLSAFLRVVGDGMPPRPARFRRRLRAAEYGHDVSTARDNIPHDNGATITLSLTGSTKRERSVDPSALDVLHSSSLGRPTSESDDPLFKGNIESEAQQGGLQQPGFDEQATTLLKADERTSVTSTTVSLSKLRKTSSARKERRLPVNELALSRTTSSDGLPQPSDAEYVFAAPVTAADPIQDSQMLSYTSFKTASRQLAARRVQKSSLMGRDSIGFSAMTLRERFTTFDSPTMRGDRHKRALRPGLATCSDGFTSAELTVQHTKKPTRFRASNKTRIKKSVLDVGGLTLTCGHLPAPALEQQEVALTLAERPSYTENRTSLQTPIGIVHTHPPSQHAVLGVRRTLIKKNARRHHTRSPRQTDLLVRDQSSNVKPPARRISENSSLAYTLQTEVTPYFESAMRSLGTEERSDSVNGEFWDRYPNLESER